jgi:rubredoxin
MWLLVHRNAKTRLVAGGRSFLEVCPECGRKARFDEIEITKSYGVFFIDLLDDKEHKYRCSACHEVFDRRDDADGATAARADDARQAERTAAEARRAAEADRLRERARAQAAARARAAEAEAAEAPGCSDRGRARRAEEAHGPLTRRAAAGAAAEPQHGAVIGVHDGVAIYRPSTVSRPALSAYTRPERSSATGV